MGVLPGGGELTRPVRYVLAAWLMLGFIDVKVSFSEDCGQDQAWDPGVQLSMPSQAVGINSQGPISYAQTLIVGTEGILCGIDLQLLVKGAPEHPLLLEVRDATNGIDAMNNSTLLASKVIETTPAPLHAMEYRTIYVDLLDMPRTVRVGQSIALVFSSKNRIGVLGAQYYALAVNRGANPYAPGRAYWYSQDTWQNLPVETDIFFKTYIDTQGAVRPVPRLSLSKIRTGTELTESSQTGRIIEFKLVGANVGSARANHVKVFDKLDPNLRFVPSHSSDGCYEIAQSNSDHSRMVACDLGELAVGESKPVQISVRACQASDETVNEAFIEADNVVRANATHKFKIEEYGLPDLAVSIESVEWDKSTDPKGRNKIVVSVINSGTAPANGFYVYALPEVDSSQPDRRPSGLELFVPTLCPITSMSAEMDLRAVNPQANLLDMATGLRVVVDPKNSLPELDEANNMAFKTLPVH